MLDISLVCVNGIVAQILMIFGLQTQVCVHSQGSVGSIYSYLVKAKPILLDMACWMLIIFAALMSLSTLVYM